MSIKCKEKYKLLQIAWVLLLVVTKYCAIVWQIIKKKHYVNKFIRQMGAFNYNLHILNSW